MGKGGSDYTRIPQARNIHPCSFALIYLVLAGGDFCQCNQLDTVKTQETGAYLNQNYLTSVTARHGSFLSFRIFAVCLIW